MYTSYTTDIPSIIMNIYIENNLLYARNFLQISTIQPALIGPQIQYTPNFLLKN